MCHSSSISTIIRTTAFSTAACRIDDLIAAAVANDMPAVALTDHGVMFGAIEFYKKATKAGIKPIIGMEAYIVTKGSRLEKATAGRRSRGEAGGYHHLVLLAKDETGYRNLLKLCTHRPSRRVLLQAPDRYGGAPAAPGRARRPLRLRRRGGLGASRLRQRRGGLRGGRDLQGDLRRRFLHRDPESRHRAGEPSSGRKPRSWRRTSG